MLGPFAIVVFMGFFGVSGPQVRNQIHLQNLLLVLLGTNFLSGGFLEPSVHHLVKLQSRTVRLRF